jgi:hypothetical protein
MPTFKITNTFNYQINNLVDENKAIIKQLLQMLHPFQQEDNNSAIIGSLDELRSWLITHQQQCRTHIASASNICPRKSSVAGSMLGSLICLTTLITSSTNSEATESADSALVLQATFILLLYAMVGMALGYGAGIAYNGLFAQSRQQEQLKIFDSLCQKLSGITNIPQSIYYTSV